MSEHANPAGCTHAARGVRTHRQPVAAPLPWMENVRDLAPPPTRAALARAPVAAGNREPESPANHNDERRLSLSTGQHEVKS